MFKRFRLAALMIGGLAIGAVATTASAAAAPLSPFALDQSTEASEYAAASLPAPPDGANGAIGGEVSGVSGSTYTIAGPEGASVSITTTTSTTYLNVDGSAASASSIKAGTFVVAEGTFANQGKTLTAQRITIGKPQGGLGRMTASPGPGPADGEPGGVLRAGIGGKVSSVNGSSYTLAGPDESSVTVTVRQDFT